MPGTAGNWSQWARMALSAPCPTSMALRATQHTWEESWAPLGEALYRGYSPKVAPSMRQVGGNPWFPPSLPREGPAAGRRTGIPHCPGQGGRGLTRGPGQEGKRGCQAARAVGGNPRAGPGGTFRGGGGDCCPSQAAPRGQDRHQPPGPDQAGPALGARVGAGPVAGRHPGPAPAPFWMRSCAADAFLLLPLVPPADSSSFFCCFSENSLIILPGRGAAPGRAAGAGGPGAPGREGGAGAAPQPPAPGRRGREGPGGWVPAPGRARARGWGRALARCRGRGRPGCCRCGVSATAGPLGSFRHRFGSFRPGLGSFRLRFACFRARSPLSARHSARPGPSPALSAPRLAPPTPGSASPGRRSAVSAKARLSAGDEYPAGTESRALIGPALSCFRPLLGSDYGRKGSRGKRPSPGRHLY